MSCQGRRVRAGCLYPQRMPEATPRRPPTMADVAERAGVSRALVSIVFRDQPGASAGTRTRVREAAAALGYTPDFRAQLLGRRRAGTLGVAFGLGHDFHGELVEELYAAAERHGLSLELSGFGHRRGERDAVLGLMSYRCEGLVLVGTSIPVRWIKATTQGVPTVLAARASAQARLGVVRTDDVAGAAVVTRHLLELGHRRLVHVAGGRAPGTAERRTGFLTAVAGTPGATGAVVAGGVDEEQGLRAGHRLAELLPDEDAPTAVVAFNDRCAVGVIAALRLAGFSVPGHVSVVGFDGSRLAAVPGVDLTTVQQDTAGLAGAAVDQLSGPPGRGRLRHLTIAPSLVVRSSSAAPRNPDNG